MKWETKSDYRKRRHMRLRRKVKGTPERPRMAVFKSNQHLYVQFIDDENSVTLASTSSNDKAFRSAGKKLNVETAKALGGEAAKAAQSKGVEEVVFDRGGFRYGGRIKALAEGAREAGLKF